MGGDNSASKFGRHFYMGVKVNRAFIVYDMVNRKAISVIAGLFVLVCSCKKGEDGPSTTTPVNYNLITWSINNISDQITNYNVPGNPSVSLRFGAAINKTTAANNIILKENNGSIVNSTISYGNGDSVIILQPGSPLNYLSKYKVSVGNQLKSTNGGNLVNPTEISLTTTIDSSRKFPVISEDALLDSVQKRTFKYFWDLAHPTSGLARERNTDANTYTSGGTGFGIMAIVSGYSS